MVVVWCEMEWVWGRCYVCLEEVDAFANGGGPITLTVTRENGGLVFDSTLMMVVVWLLLVDVKGSYSKQDMVEDCLPTPITAPSFQLIC